MVKCHKRLYRPLSVYWVEHYRTWKSFWYGSHCGICYLLLWAKCHFIVPTYMLSAASLDFPLQNSVSFRGQDCVCKINMTLRVRHGFKLQTNNESTYLVTASAYSVSEIKTRYIYNIPVQRTREPFISTAKYTMRTLKLAEKRVTTLSVYRFSYCFPSVG